MMRISKLRGFPKLGRKGHEMKGVGRKSLISLTKIVLDASFMLVFVGFGCRMLAELSFHDIGLKELTHGVKIEVLDFRKLDTPTELYSGGNCVCQSFLREREGEEPLLQSCNQTIEHSSRGHCNVACDLTVLKVVNAVPTNWRNTYSCQKALDFIRFRSETEEMIAGKSVPGSTLSMKPALTSFTDAQSTPGNSPVRPFGNMSTKRGIIIPTLPTGVALAVTLIEWLRQIGCELPVEVWTFADELSAKQKQYLHEFGDVAHREIHDEHVSGFMVKPLAVVYSQFDEVLLLDTDNIPVRDPTVLFDHPAYVESAAIFWPDHWRPGFSIFDLTNESLVWEMFGLDPSQDSEQESGQLVINRKKSKLALKVLELWALNFQIVADIGVVYGDKDLFRLAWRKTQTPYHFVRSAPAIVGHHRSGANHFCGLAIGQYYPQSRTDIMFLHRNSLKINTNKGMTQVFTHVVSYEGDDIEHYRAQWVGLELKDFGRLNCWTMEEPYKISTAPEPITEAEHWMVTRYAEILDDMQWLKGGDGAAEKDNVDASTER